MVMAYPIYAAAQTRLTLNSRCKAARAALASHFDHQAVDGYAITHHAYHEPGDYIVSVQRSRNDGVTATTRQHVGVAED